MRTFILLPFLALFANALAAQTHFYIDQITVSPAAPSTSDNVSIALIGNLSDGGAYIATAVADVGGGQVNITLVALSNGGITVLVPHTEVLQLGQLPAGEYVIDFTDASTGILDGAPASQHTFTVSGGSVCDDLELISVRWAAFNDTAVVVHVQNSSVELFDYPNFILFNGQGDTLAKETVNFFGITSDSWHILRIQDGVSVPEIAFNGRLELWTEFTDQLACSWEQEFSLCPPGPCSDIEIMLSNLLSMEVIGTFNWAVFDAFGNVDAGQFALTQQAQTVSANVCLPPGEYFLNVSPTDPGFPFAPTYNAIAAGWQFTASGSAVSSLPQAVPFTLYAPCISGTQSVTEQGARELRTRYRLGGVIIETSDGSPLGHVWLFDAQGRLHYDHRTNGEQLFIPLPAATVYLLRAGELSVKVLGGLE